MDLTAERTRVLDHARTILDKAKAEGRTDVTDAEHHQLEADVARVKELDQQLKGRAVVNSIKALGAGVNWSDDDGSSSSVFSEEARYGIGHAVKTRTAYRTTVDTKALLVTGTMLPTSGDGVQPGLHPSAYPLSSLFAQEAASGPVQRYYRMGAGAAAVVAEGALKPDAGITITPVDLTLEKLAALAQFSDEMGDDAPFLVDHLTQELSTAVAQAENARIVTTFGATSGVLTGTGTNATVVDAVADAIAGQEALSGLTPNAVIAHPTVVAAIRKTKASTSGVYVLDPTAPGPSSIFGVPVVSTPAVAATVVWVVERTGVVIYRRGGLAVDIGTNADDFAHNVKTARAEERIGTAVMRPSCLTKVTLS